MSSYSTVWDRARRESRDREAPKGAAPGRPPRAETQVRSHDPLRAKSPRSNPDALGGTRPVVATGQEEPYALLLDTIRTLHPRVQAPCVVLAATSGAEAIGHVVSGLVAAGSSRGVRVVALELEVTRDGPSLRAHPSSGIAEDELPPFELTTSEPEDRIESWLRESLGRHDVVAIEAPALCSSADGAFLGRSVDGLFLVAEQGRTRARHLEKAAQRAESASCDVHGLVVTESKSFLPSWLERLLPTGS